ncbi:MAG: hypothetical protein HQ567_14535 [Candidatus Nealsonbacteria bacterium]|nr:hypothetical protein [Candidatus Nealsonbacteria bacterium]
MTSHSTGNDGASGNSDVAAPSPYDPPPRGLPVAGLCLLCAILASVAVLVAVTVWLSRVAGPPGDLQSGPGVDETVTAPPATAWVQVMSRKPAILFEDTEPIDPEEFDALRRTQRQLLKSDFVLTAALNDPEVRKLNLQERPGTDAGWVADRLEVTFPDNSEIMQVGMPGVPPEEATVIVNSVVRAYLSEIVAKEKDERGRRLDELDAAYASKENEVRKRLNDLKELADKLGTSAGVGLDLKQQYMLDEYRDSRRELQQVRAEVRLASADLQAQNAAYEAVDDMAVTDAEVDDFIASDPLVGRMLYDVIAQFQQRLADLEVVATPEASTQLAAKLKDDMATVESLIEPRRQRLREQLREARRGSIKAELRLLKARATVLLESEREIADEVDSRRVEIERLAETPVDLDMMRGEARQLADILYEIGIQRERLRIELRAPSQIRVIQLAESQ